MARGMFPVGAGAWRLEMRVPIIEDEARLARDIARAIRETPA
jgi:hypothetical protein